VFLVRRRQRGADFRALLSAVRRQYRGWQVTLLLDEDSSHTAKHSVFWAELLGIGLQWLAAAGVRRVPELRMGRQGR
jgi:hypothetical protein